MVKYNCILQMCYYCDKNISGMVLVTTNELNHMRDSQTYYSHSENYCQECLADHELYSEQQESSTSRSLDLFLLRMSQYQLKIIEDALHNPNIVLRTKVSNEIIENLDLKNVGSEKVVDLILERARFMDLSPEKSSVYREMMGNL